MPTQKQTLTPCYNTLATALYPFDQAFYYAIAYAGACNRNPERAILEEESVPFRPESTEIYRVLQRTR